MSGVAGADAPHPFSIGDFRFLWLARFSASFATMAMIIVLGWQTYDLARSDYGYSIGGASFLLGMLGLAQFIPLFLLTPFAGWVADRFERGRVAMVADGIDLVIALTLALATYHDWLTLPLLFLLAALHGVARVFIGPAMSSIAPNIVPAGSLPRAIALSSIAWQSATVAGPAVGGLLYAVRPDLAYWMACGFLLLAIGALGPIRPVVPPPMAQHIHPIRQMIDGLTNERGHRCLLGAITLDLFAVLMGGATALLPVYARDILHVGAEGLGQLRAAPALGSVIIGLYFSIRPLKTNVGVKMLAAVVGFGIATIGFGLSALTPSQPLNLPGFGPILRLDMAVALLSLAFVGGFDMLSVFVRNSLVQLHTPDAMRGRVSAVSGVAISASNELGEVQSGIAAALLGPVGAVVAGGAGAALITLWWARVFPELRNARSFDPPNNI